MNFLNILGIAAMITGVLIFLTTSLRDPRTSSVKEQLAMRRKTIRWNHCNPALQYPFRLIIDDNVARAAMAAGHDCWLIYDEDEKLLAQGVFGDRWS